MRAFLLVVLAACSSAPASPTSPNPPKQPKPGVDPNTIVLDTPTDTPYGLAVDDYNVYFTLVDTGIRRTPKHGGGPVEVVASDDHGPHRIVLDDVYIYIADLGTPDADFNDGRLARVTKFGGELQILDSNLGATDDLVLHGDYVLYSCAGTRSFGAYNNDGAIFRLPRAGGTPVRLAKNQRHPIAITADETYVYWLNDYQGSIMRCAIAGCSETPEIVYADQNVPRSIVVDSEWIYWTNQQDTNVVRAPKSGSGPITELAASRGFPASLVLDHSELYWTEVLTHTVQTLPKDGAFRPTAVAQDLGLPVQVVVDLDSVYFTDQERTNVVRVPR